MDDDNRDETAIRSLVELWHRATAAGDIARVLTLMADDVVFLTAGRPPINGRASFAQGLKQLLETHEVSSTGDVREVRASGDLAYCWSDLTVTIRPLDGGDPTQRKGPALSIFRRQPNGVWLLLRDANMLASDTADLELKVDNLERELMADGPGGD